VSAPQSLAVAIPTADGVRLAGHWTLPSQATRRTVLVAGGLGVPQRFYRAFADWLAARGHPVLRFDLRGMGESREPRHRRSLRGLQADMLSWARLDFAAAVAHAAERQADGRITVLGHSLGAHHAIMTDATTQARISRLIAVAAGSGYWRDWHPRSRRRAPLMLHLAGPLLIPLMGWFPGRRLGMVGDLPGPAARQWMRWCRHPQFAWGAEPERVRPSLQTACFEIDAFGFADDEAMTEACCRQLLAAVPQAPSQFTLVRPPQVGLRAIGHVGAFRPEGQSALWPLLARTA
jgi:predicted alpha/beta hydrolase